MNLLTSLLINAQLSHSLVIQAYGPTSKPVPLMPGGESFLFGDGYTMIDTLPVEETPHDFTFAVGVRTYYGGTIASWGQNCIAIEDPISSRSGRSALSLTIDGHRFAVAYPTDIEFHQLVVSHSSTAGETKVCVDSNCDTFTAKGHDADIADVHEIKFGHGECWWNSTGSRNVFFRGSLDSAYYLTDFLSTDQLMLAFSEGTFDKHTRVLRDSEIHKPLKDIEHMSLTNDGCIDKGSNPPIQAAGDQWAVYLLGHLRSFPAGLAGYQQFVCDVHGNTKFVMVTGQTVDHADLPWYVHNGQGNEDRDHQDDELDFKGRLLTPPSWMVLQYYQRKYPHSEFCVPFDIAMFSDREIEKGIPMKYRGQQGGQGGGYLAKVHAIKMERLSIAHRQSQLQQPHGMVIVTRPDFTFDTSCSAQRLLQDMADILKQHPLTVFVQDMVPKAPLQDMTFVTSHTAIDIVLKNRTSDLAEGVFPELQLYHTFKTAGLDVVTGDRIDQFIHKQFPSFASAPSQICDRRGSFATSSFTEECRHNVKFEPLEDRMRRARMI
mmetsp:Transcript_107470/g.283367  ORF Transcript_107470/g.283367 Transcript_107470/m.283367 type:complete len:547 (+) Transcript_107470:36-1676(+)